jgi:GT2 family glycosyltransferase
MVAGKMLYTDSPTTINSTGISLDRAGIAWDRAGGQDDVDLDDVEEVFGPCAGAALYRRELFDDVGVFDDDFFAYLEDVDLAWRARLAGWRCGYAPRARVLHDHSATAKDDSAFKRYHLGRNKVWLIAKNYPTPYLWLYLPLIILYDLAAVATVTAGIGPGPSSFSARLARLAGRTAGLLSVNQALAKRRSVQSRRRVPRWRVLGSMSRVSSPWSIYRRFGHLLSRQVARLAGLTTE